MGGDTGNHKNHIWRDQRRFWFMLAAFVPLLPVAGGLLASSTGMRMFWWLAAAFIFFLVPAFDLALGRDRLNPPEEHIPALEADRFYRYCTYLFLPLQYNSLVWSCYMWSYGQLDLPSSAGLAVANGIVAGIAINTAHELGHKDVLLERWLSKVALAQSFYGHFFVEHNRGHHVRVATPEDPASARLGEGFWAFLPRTVTGSLKSAWSLEKRRLEKAEIRFWDFRRNDLLNAWSLSVVLFGGLTAAFGVRILPWLALQAMIGIALLEVVNYIEHYGLLRQKKPNGRYERCQPQHSWNSDIRASNILLFQLQRHSDHHANPMRRYQTLRTLDEAPQLPAGYATMILLALIPPVWRRVMDGRIVHHYQGDMQRANIAPSRRRNYGVQT